MNVVLFPDGTDVLDIQEWTTDWSDQRFVAEEAENVRKCGRVEVQTVIVKRRRKWQKV